MKNPALLLLLCLIALPVAKSDLSFDLSAAGSLNLQDFDISDFLAFLEFLANLQGGGSGGANIRIIDSANYPNLNPQVFTNTCICPQIYAPVCGEDGIFYANSCIANCRSVIVAHTGRCGGAPVCYCFANSAPVCGNDGIQYLNRCYLDCVGVPEDTTGNACA